MTRSRKNPYEQGWSDSEFDTKRFVKPGYVGRVEVSHRDLSMEEIRARAKLDWSVRLGVVKGREKGDYKSPTPQPEWMVSLGPRFGGEPIEDLKQMAAIIEQFFSKDMFESNNQNRLDSWAGRPPEQKNVRRNTSAAPKKSYGWILHRWREDDYEDRPILHKEGDFVVYQAFNEGDVPKDDNWFFVKDAKKNRFIETHARKHREAVAIAKAMNGPAQPAYKRYNAGDKEAWKEVSLIIKQARWGT